MIIPRKFVKWTIDFYYMSVLVVGTEAFGTIIKGGSSSGGGAASSPIYTVFWAVVYFVSLIRVFERRRAIAPMLKANKALCFMIGLMTFSYYWSISRADTLHAVVTLILTTVFAMDFSLRFTMKRQLELVAKAMAFLLVVSVIAEVVFPGYVPVEQAESASAWHGVFEFKNNFGRVICLGVISCLASSRKTRLVKAGIFIGGVGLAVMSRAMSFVGYTILLSGVLAGWSILKWRPRPRLVAILAIGIMIVGSIYYVAQNIVKVTSMMDKDPHMTGRVELWQYSIVYIEQRPLLGYGASAFWNVDSQQARRVREATFWDEAPHAHNAYIDTGLSLGLVGLVAYLVMYFTVFGRAFRYFMDGKEDYRRWPLTFLVFVFIYQLTESGILAGGNVLWMIFSSLAFSLAMEKQSSTIVLDTPLLAESAA